MELFKNPFQMPGEETTGDPYVLRHNGTYYFYKTNFKDHFVCAWKSDNLVDWSDYHMVCSVPEAFGAYAPEVHYINGRFYMVASSRGNGHFMYVADDPFGPFECITGRFGQRIDGTFFLDDDGTEYFYRAETDGICYHEMPENGKVDTRPHQIPESNLGGWTEGPLVWHRDGYYYLTYTGNHLLSRGYRIAYSVSDKSPVSGYVNMKNRTLLLEVEDEFHALGHSSSALAPDMDGAYIIYHNYDFLAEKPYRMVNVDRLFFNGARMYNNTCWWDQEKPELASHSWRGCDELEVSEGIAWLPVVPGDEYTAEFNLNLHSGARIYYGEGVIQLAPEGVSVIENGRVAAMASMPKNTSFTANMTIRVMRRHDGFMKLILNRDQELVKWTSELDSGNLGITAQKAEPDKFFALSPYAFGSSDKVIRKAVPGRFDAVHALQDVNRVSAKENGMEVFVADAQEGDSFTYPVNVREDGTYELSVLVRGKGPVAFQVIAGTAEQNGQAAEDEMQTENLSVDTTLWAECSVLDRDGSCWVNLGAVELKAGFQEITLTALENMTVDAFKFTAVEEVEEGVYIQDSQLVKPLDTIIGEKGTEAVISKEYGFTSSEAPNFSFWGKKGWDDFSVRATVHVLKAGDGFAALLLRASKESWFDKQVVDSVDALEVRFDADGVTVSRLNYEKKILGCMMLDFDEEWLNVECTIRQNTLSVMVEGMGAMVLDLPELPAAGRLGIRFDTENFGFGELSVEKA